MGREADGHVDRVNNPAENLLEGGPSIIAGPELFDADGFAAAWRVVGGQRSENCINGMKQGCADAVL